MTGVERIGAILRRRPVDRIGLFEHFWSDTQKVWTAQGHIAEGENLAVIWQGGVSGGEAARNTPLLTQR